MITGKQAKAAREMLGWSRPRLSARAAVSDLTIQKFEEGLRPANRKIVEIQRALEAAGIEFAEGAEPKLKAKAAKPAMGDEAAIGDDPEGRGDPFIGSAK